jgi:hypothetical protein
MPATEITLLFYFLFRNSDAKKLNSQLPILPGFGYYIYPFVEAVEAKTVKSTLNIFHYKPSRIYYILHSTINYYVQLTGALTSPPPSEGVGA